MKFITTIIISVFFYSLSYAQCFPDRHNTNWFDGWLSCENSLSPNEARGNAHWILYDFSHLYSFGQMQIWNTNAPGFLEDGMKDVVIDISNNGVDWTEVGQFQFAMANGSATYEGDSGPDLGGVEGQYLLITALSNWGGQCYGISEVKIDVDAIVGTEEQATSQASCLSVNIFPNPITHYSKAYISTQCSNAPIDYSIRDITGKLLKNGQLEPLGNEISLNIVLKGFTAGSYILTLKQANVSVIKKFVKIK